MINRGKEFKNKMKVLMVVLITLLLSVDLLPVYGYQPVYYEEETYKEEHNWKDELPEEFPTEDLYENVLLVGKLQVGEEGVLNDENELTTRFDEENESLSYAGRFLRFVLQNAENENVPNLKEDETLDEYHKRLKEEFSLLIRDEEDIKPGMIVLLDLDEEEDIDHIGILEEIISPSDIDIPGEEDDINHEYEAERLANTLGHDVYRIIVPDFNNKVERILMDSEEADRFVEWILLEEREEKKEEETHKATMMKAPLRGNNNTSDTLVADDLSVIVSGISDVKWTGESLDAEINVSRSSAETNDVYRIYFEVSDITTDANGKQIESAFVVPTISVGGRNMTPGQSYYLNEEAHLNPFSFHKAEGYDNLYYLEIPEPEFGSTFKTDMKVLYPSPNTHGGNVKMWVTEHPASQSSVPEKIDPADDHYVNSTWKTARIEYYPTKQLQDDTTPSIAYNSGKEAYYVTDLDYMFVMHAQEPENVPPNGLGEDFTDFLYFEDTIQLPNDMEWDPEVLNYLRTSGEIFQTGNTRWLVLGYRDENYNRKYVTWIHSSFTMQQPYFRVDGNNVVIGWQYENPAVGPIDLSRFNRIGSYSAEVMNLDFEDDVIRIKQNPSEPVVVGKEYTINNKIDSTDSFMHVEDENNTDILPVTVVVKPGELIFEKHHKNGNSTFSILKYGDPLPYPFTITAKNKGSFALPANSITDTLPNMYYLTPANIATMFNESDDTSTVLEKEGGGTELTITITNAKICDDIDNHNVTTADGDTAVAKPQYNSDGNTYLPGQTVDPCELTDQGTITFVRNGNNIEITRAAFGSTPAQTVSVNITASAIENALREMGFIIGPETTYAFEWMIPGGIINGGESYIRKIPANVKDSFMLLDGDERHYAQASISSTNIANLTGDNPKTATDTTITATREWEIHKDATVDGLNITGPDMLTPGTVVDYQLKITRSGFGTDYEALPLTDEIRGAQILLAIANDKNAHLETEHPSIEKKTINGVEYYMLDQVGQVYKNVWFEGQLSQYGVNSSVDLCADSVTVTSATDNKGNVTLIQWYLDISDYGNRQYDLSALYKVFIDPERTEYDNTEGNVELDNTGFLGDHQTERIYDDTEYEIPRLGANKEIVTQKGATHIEDSLATHTSIREGEEVTYRLTITKIGDTPLELTQDDFWDALPETVSGSNWIKGVNVLSIQLPEQDGVTVLQGDIENDWDISQTPPGGRTEDPGDDTKQYIVWDNVRIRLTKEAFIYVTVKYPEGNDWDALVLKYGSDPLINTFHVQEHQSSVQHNIYNETKAELFKSVADTGTINGIPANNVSNNYGTGRLIYSNGSGGRSNIGWDYKYGSTGVFFKTGYVVYDVTLYNDGGTRLYLNEFQDTLPRGFHLGGGVSLTDHAFRSTSANYNKEGTYNWVTDATDKTISSIQDPDGTPIVGKTAAVHAASVKEISQYVNFVPDPDFRDTVTFSIDNVLDDNTVGNLNYDEHRNKYYLNPGEMLSFAYWVYIDRVNYTDDIATNTIAMPFDNYYGTGVEVDKNVKQISDDYQDNKNDGAAGLMSHADIQSNPNYQVTGSTPETQWLTSEVSLGREPVVPGINKNLKSRTTQGGTTLSDESDLQKATYTDKLNWEIKVYNDSKTTPLSDYVITDIIDNPYVLTGPVTYSLNDSSDPVITFGEWNDDFTEVSVVCGSGWSSSEAVLKTDGTVLSFMTYASGVFQVSLKRLDDGRLRFDFRVSESFYHRFLTNLYPTKDLSLAPSSSATLRLTTTNPTTNYDFNEVYNEAFVTPVIQQDFDSDNIVHGTYVNDDYTGIYPGDWNYGGRFNITYQPSLLEYANRRAVEAMTIVPIDQDAATRSIKTVTEKDNPTNTVSSSIEALWIELPDADTVVTYTNEVTNLLENDIPKFVMIDSLPDVHNDHYSFDTEHKRYSAFSVNFAANPNFVLTITDENNVARALDPSEYSIEYSDNTEFTDNDWDGGSATHWTSAKKPTSRSFRIIINNSSAPYIISRHSKLIVSYDAIIDTNSFDESAGNIAWNSFGYRYKPINAETALQSTPLKVGIKTRGPQKTFVKELVTYNLETTEYEPLVYADPTGENNPLKYQFVVTKSRITVDKNSVDVRADFISELQDLIDNSGTFGFFEVAIDSGSSRSNEITFGEVENGLLNERIVSGDGNPWVWEDNTQYYIYEIPHLNSKIVDVTLSDATTTESVLEDPSRIGINTHPFVRGAKFTYKDAKDLIFKASNEDTWSLVVEKKNDDSTKSLNGAVYGLYSLNPDDKVSSAKYEEYTTLVHTFDEEYTIPQTVVGSDDKTYYLMNIKVTGTNIDSAQSYKQGFIDFEGLTLETYLLKELIAP